MKITPALTFYYNFYNPRNILLKGIIILIKCPLKFTERELKAPSVLIFLKFIFLGQPIYLPTLTLCSTKQTWQG